MNQEKVKATDFLNYTAIKPNMKKAVLPADRQIKKRKKKPIFVYTERPVKKLVLKLLGEKFKYQVKDTYTVNENNFFELLLHYIDSVKFEDQKIVFCKTEGKEITKVVSVNFSGLKEKFRTAVEKILKNADVDSQGVSRDAKLVKDLMIICQTCYVRATDPDKKKILSTTPAKKGSGRMTESVHFQNQ